MSMTSYSLRLSLLLFIMAKVSGLLLFPREIGHAAFGVPRQGWIPWCEKCPFLFSDNGPNKTLRGGKGGWGLIVFCRYRGQQPAACFMESPLSFHMLVEICSFPPDTLAWTCWSALCAEREHAVFRPGAEQVSKLLHWISLEHATVRV